MNEVPIAIPPAHDRFWDTAHSIGEVARYLHVTERFLHAAISRGHLKVQRPSRNLTRILPDDLRSWLHNGGKSTEVK
jgi:excisionase family DNA binding protein